MVADSDRTPRLATNTIFTTVLVSLLNVNYCFFVTLVMSFYICKQDLLLTDIHLSQGTLIKTIYMHLCIAEHQN